MSLSPRLLGRGNSGFTFLELFVALAIMGLILSIVVPRYWGGVSKAEEAVLKDNLLLLREAVDKYHADSGRYPDSLNDLVTRRYLRKIPIDPITQSDTTWVVVPSADPQTGAILNVASGATGIGSDGRRYAQW